ncbi:MAG: hypothetical protein ACRDQA_12180 [Nocardioidaceae bacterium]
MTVLGVTGPMSKHGVAKDPEFLRQVTATRAYQRLQSSGKLSGLTAAIALRKPLQAMKVPAGALFDVAGKHACVQSGSRTIPVTILGAKLGASLVRPKGTPPDNVNLGPAITRESCGHGGR